MAHPNIFPYEYPFDLLSSDTFIFRIPHAYTYEWDLESRKPLERGKHGKMMSFLCSYFFSDEIIYERFSYVMRYD